MSLFLRRFCYSPMGTFGELSLTGTGLLGYTVERPWASNLPNESCIPEGAYLCRRGLFPRHGEAFEVVNVPRRFGILFHVANTMDNVKGCIGIGSRLGFMNQRWAVADSEQAVARFMLALTGRDEIPLSVLHVCHT